MFLASLLSVFAGAWLFAAAPFTVTMKSAGYSARSDGKTVTVTRVVPGSVAAEAGLEKGMKVTGVPQPFRAFIKVPLPQLGATDLQDALTPQPAEDLWLRVETKRGPDQLILKSREPLPDNPFPVMPLTAAQQERLTPLQANRYQARMVQSAMEAMRRPRAELRQRTTAYVVKGRLTGIDGGGATPLWLHPSMELRTPCGDRLEKVELSSATGDVNLTLRPGEAGEPGGPFELAPPLWPVQQVLQCKSTPTDLERTLHVKLSCKGLPPGEQDVSVKLTVHCDEPYGASRRAQPPLVLGEPKDFLVGDKTPLQLEVFAHQLIPRPTEVTVVELDAQGQVTRRLAPAPMGKNAREPGQRLQLTLDTTARRTARLALEARFSDGSTWLSEPQTREIRTRAQVEALRREALEANDRADAFLEDLHDRFSAPCADLPTTMKWILAHPAIESAQGTSGKIYYRVKGSASPYSAVFMCGYD
ncbi:hypothetical protein HMI49_16830 [Corallococcus exercitus]|uniref:PDZ domain-containing protein n=1 Tax=Corallococcus exercitus TaxID=2316736 RepID=A0A7Y4NSK8_9BACT|nr:PDZ domain-containing protein [Corallococcus exercitus]NOK34866.1 hypothetical protein [Corallococcus exercitus]